MNVIWGVIEGMLLEGERRLVSFDSDIARQFRPNIRQLKIRISFVTAMYNVCIYSKSRMRYTQTTNFMLLQTFQCFPNNMPLVPAFYRAIPV